MKATLQFISAVLMLATSLVHADDADFKVATIISAEQLAAAQAEAPADQVSDQPISHVESAEGRLGIGVVHRPIIEPGGPIAAIQHHKQSEVYRVMAGSGILVTSSSMASSVAIDPDGNIVRNLVGPSDRGIIEDIENSEEIGTGDVIIIPAGVAHGFSEISEPITYMVVRVDPEKLVALK